MWAKLNPLGEGVESANSAAGRGSGRAASMLL